PVDHAEIDKIQEGSPAEQAGFENGDEIIKIDETTISTFEEFQAIVRDNPKTELDMTVSRNGENVELSVVPDSVYIEELDVELGQIGVYQAFHKSAIGTVKYGFTKTYEITTLILTNL